MLSLPQGRLDDVFDLPPIESSKVINGEIVVVENHDVQVSNSSKTNELSSKIEDSKFIRDELKSLIEITKDALDSALMTAQNDPDPKAMEAASKVISTLTASLVALTNLNKIESDRELKLKDMSMKETKPAKPAEVTNIQNNLIVSDTASIIEMIMNKNKELR